MPFPKAVVQIEEEQAELELSLLISFSLVIILMPVTLHHIYGGVVVIVVGNGHGDTSSNPGRD